MVWVDLALAADAGLAALLGGDEGGDACGDGGGGGVAARVLLLPVDFVLLPSHYIVSFRHCCLLETDRERVGGV